MTSYLRIRDAIRAAIRESRDDYAKTPSGIVANLAGVWFRDPPNPHYMVSWDSMFAATRRKAISWGWGPNIPKHPLEKLAEVAE